MRTKDVAGRMGGELDEHAKMLEELDHGVTGLNGEVHRQTGSIRRILETGESKGFFIACAILILTLIVLIAI
jgi:hypothetical protein